MSKPTLTTGGRGGRYWYASYTDHSGQRRRKSLGAVSSMTRRQALRKLADIEQQAATGTVQQGKAPKLSAWLEHYIKCRPDYADATIQLYNQAVDHLTDHIGNLPIDKITKQHAATYPPYLIKLKLEPATAHKHARCIRALLNEAVEQDIIIRNPFAKIRTPGQAETTFEYVGPDKLAKLLDACPDYTWRVLIALTRLGGLRLGEAMRLEWTDVNWQEHTITVRSKRKNRTTKDKTRLVPAMPNLFDILLTSFEAGEPVPVGLPRWAFSGSTCRGYQTIEKIIKQAGLTQWDKPFHTLRKSLESDWLAVYPVMDVARWLGHSPSVAAQHYHQTTPETMAKVTGKQDSKDQIIQQMAKRINELEQQLEVFNKM